MSEVIFSPTILEVSKHLYRLHDILLLYTCTGYIDLQKYDQQLTVEPFHPVQTERE